jgi:hypothetical protein
MHENTQNKTGSDRGSVTDGLPIPPRSPPVRARGFGTANIELALKFVLRLFTLPFLPDRLNYRRRARQ